MRATHKLLLLAIFVYGLLPLPWVVWRPEGLFYSFDLSLLPTIALVTVVFLSGWWLGGMAGPRQPWFDRHSSAADVAAHWPVSVVAIVVALACSLAANTILFVMGALTIDELTGRIRVPVITTLGSAHIFALIVSACLWFVSPRGRVPRLTAWLLAVSVLVTIGIGLLEGRRTAVVLPIVVFLALAFINGRADVLKRLLVAAPVFAALFAVTTYARTAVEDAPELDEAVLLVGGDALVGRVANALLILDPILDHARHERTPMDPQTLRSVVSGLPNLGLVSPPFETGFGNEFGRQLGLLPATNDFTGINSGWLGELLLLGGFPALFVGGLLLSAMAAAAWRLLPARHPAGLFLRVMVVIFILSGFQMEVAFPIASLFRATLIAVCLAAGEHLLARRRAVR